MRYVIYMVNLTPIKAPKHASSLTKKIIEERKLREKYGSVADHLDFVFMPFYCFLREQFLPGLNPSTVRGFINNFAHTSGMPYRVLSACVPEDRVDVYIRVFHKSNVRTLCNSEIILPRTTIPIVVDVDDNIVNEFVKKIMGIVNKTITVAGWRSIGFGSAVITSIEPFEKARERILKMEQRSNQNNNNSTKSRK